MTEYLKLGKDDGDELRLIKIMKFGMRCVLKKQMPKKVYGPYETKSGPFSIYEIETVSCEDMVKGLAE